MVFPRPAVCRPSGGVRAVPLAKCTSETRHTFKDGKAEQPTLGKGSLRGDFPVPRLSLAPMLRKAGVWVAGS